jgi:hypothetical protein
MQTEFIGQSYSVMNEQRSGRRCFMRKAWWLVVGMSLTGCSSPHKAFLMNAKVPDSYIKALAAEERVSEDTIRERLAKQREAAADPAKATAGKIPGSRGAIAPTYPAAKRTAR